MSWSNAGKFRNTNPVLKINRTNRGTPIILYQPGVLNPTTRKQGVTYSGMITNLRAKIAISSLLESYRPPDGPSQSLEEYALALEAYDQSVPRKSLMVMLTTAASPPVVIVHLHLFKRPPFYVIDLLSYLTNTITLDLASDARLLVQSVDIGYGDLTADDEIVIWGSAIEEEENAECSIEINNYGGGGGGTTPDLGVLLGVGNDALSYNGFLLRPPSA